MKNYWRRVSLGLLGLSMACAAWAESAQVLFRQNVVTVELAQTDESRKTGLMHRAELGRDQGMLFVFPEEGRYSFWMKDTPLSLDIIWFDQDYRVVYIEQKTVPYSTKSLIPIAPARYVLEVNAGVVKEWGLVLGDRVNVQAME